MTLFVTVYDSFLTIVRDYELDELFQSDQDDFYTILEGYLIKSLPDFIPYSLTGLEYTLNVDPKLSSFDNDLSAQEINILAEAMLSTWMTKELNDNTQTRLKLQNSDFKTYAEANNLKEKANVLKMQREIVNRAITRYQWTDGDLIDRNGL